MKLYIVLHDDFSRSPLQDFFIGAFENRNDAIQTVKDIADGYQTDISGDERFLYISWDAGAATIEETESK